MTSRLGAPTSGQVFLVPSSMKTDEITRIVNQGYDPGLLSDSFSRLLEQLELDVLMVDTHPGLNPALDRGLRCAGDHYATGQPRFLGHQRDS